MAVARSDTIEFISISSIFMSNRSYSFIFSCLALSFVLMFSLLVSSNAEAAGTCRSVEVSSNFPTTWTITGPGGVRVEGPDGSSASTGFSVTKTSTGASLPEGDYVVSVPNNVSGGQNPYYTRPNGGDGQTNGTGQATFECVRGTRLEVIVTYGGGTNAGGILQFVRTPLDFSADYHTSTGGIVGQRMGGAAYISGHFVFRGSSCSINMNDTVANGSTGGAGLWSISEDGSAVQERQMCIDAGAASNNLYFHSAVSGKLFADDSSGFLFTNHSAASYLSATESGPGATKAVHYGFSGDQVVIRGVSEEDYFNNQNVDVFSDGYSIGDRDIVRLSDWSRVGSAPDAPLNGSLGGYFVGRSNSSSGQKYKQYKLQNNNLVEVGELPGNVRSFGLQFAYDRSKSPMQLVILDPGLISSSNHVPPRLLWYTVGSSGFELAKEMELPSDFEETGAFAVWGDYLFRAFSTNSGGVLIGKVDGSTYTKIQTLVLPDGGIPSAILASPAGYIAVSTSQARNSSSTTQQNPGGFRTQVHVYKIGGGTTPPPPDTTATTTPGISLGGMADMLSFASSYLQLLQATMGNISSISPNTSFGGATSTNPAMQNIFNEAFQLINAI